LLEARDRPGDVGLENGVTTRPSFLGLGASSSNSTAFIKSLRLRVDAQAYGVDVCDRVAFGGTGSRADHPRTCRQFGVFSMRCIKDAVSEHEDWRTRSSSQMIGAGGVLEAGHEIPFFVVPASSEIVGNTTR